MSIKEELKYTIKKFGPLTERRDYSKTINNLETPDLLMIQKKSYEWFLKEGIEMALKDIYPIISTNSRIKIEYLDGKLKIEKGKSEFDDIKKAKQKGTSYVGKIYAHLRKVDDESGEINEQEVLFGEVPLMTSGGSFVINGSEKVIVSQLVRSSGVYFGRNVRNKQADDLFNKAEILPTLGSWLEIFHRVTGHTIDFVKLRLDKNKNVPITMFLRSMGMQKDTIADLFGMSKIMEATFTKDKYKTSEDSLEALHQVIRKGDRITEDSKKNLISNLLFNKRRYNLSKTGRYMLNRKLNIIERIKDTILAEDLISPAGNVVYKAKTYITEKIAFEIQDSFNSKVLATQNIPDITSSVYGSQIVDFPNLEKRIKMIMVKVYPDEKWIKAGKDAIKVIGNDPHAKEQHLLISDIIATISYYFNLINDLGNDDDTDSLKNKKIVNVGELLQNQFKIGLTKMEKNAKERMSAKEAEKVTPKNITNNKPIYNQFKAFFNSSQLSQFMDQVNPLAEISNKRRITSLGPGGLNRDTAQFEVRDVHPTHYGRICPIETPEGQNIGLILNFASYARINDLGFIETPYFRVIKGKINLKPVYLSAIDEKGKTFAQSLVEIKDGKLVGSNIVVRKDQGYTTVSPNEVDYIDVSSKQITSIAAAAIPFLENDDANRTLMGSNMQRQAVPLLRSEAPLVGTGIEADIAKYSALNIRAEKKGVVSYVDANLIKVKENASKTRTYQMKSFEKSNQGTIINQKSIVNVGDKVKEGTILTDGTSFDNGELAIGKNVLVGFTTWNGYNYEDAVIISERLVKDDVYTSLHIEEFSIQFRKWKVGDDEMTSEIPNVSTRSKRFLDAEGIVVVGSEVSAGDVLVGRISPKGEDNITPEERLVAAIFSQRSKNLKDTSLKVKHGQGGTVINVEILSRENNDKLEDGVDKIVKVSIVQKRKIKVGDKMSGRHGNKGVISRILPIEDMPHLDDGTPLDIMLNPLGVPSRMNIGQVLELHLGMAAKSLNVKFVSPIFDGIKFDDINAALIEAGLPVSGKFDLHDPITGQTFDKPISVGIMYMLKLSHMIDDKMHARSVGPYSLITQQPLGGKSQNGGQRFGEMETWAIESYGASNILQELLTYKSDNIDGRNKVYNALAVGSKVPKPGTPESFNVLGYELRGLGLKLELELDKKEQEFEEGAE